MTTITEILPTAEKILKEYSLCNACLGRLFGKKLRLNSNRLLGAKIKSRLKTKSTHCYICKDLLEDLDPYLQMMIERSKDYEFNYFTVGTILKPSIIDRDDSIRSKYRLKGIDGIKSDITGELSKMFSRKTKKKSNVVDPEFTFTINIKQNLCETRAKYLLLSGRYVKHERGIFQKQKPCNNCNGKGCRTCNFHGIKNFDSVEGQLSKLIFEKLGGTNIKFTWIGGEDKSSLVLGSGRPFFAKLNNPNKRKIKFPKIIKTNSLAVLKLSIIPEIPKQPIKFHSIIDLEIKADSLIKMENLKKLKKVIKSPIVIYEKSGKRNEKRIFSIKYQKISEKHYNLHIDAEGGLSVKRFMDDNDVNPTINKTLGISCKCVRFDFVDVMNDNK